MGSDGTGFFRKVFVLEAGAAILFFGSLMHHPQLVENSTVALSELQLLGYQTPTIAEPLRVYPAKTEGAFNSTHAGGWSPGVISVREDPQGTFGPGIYLRHELMHEASFRTCGNRLPLWAEEAAAIHFSGELAVQPPPGPPAEAQLDHLREKARVGAGLDPASYHTLASLVASFGWPRRPCGVSEEIAQLLRPEPADSGFSFILISLHSGRLLAAKGDLATRYPPGSLLKIPYAASLQGTENQAANEAIGEELAASDTQKLLARKSSFTADRFQVLTSMVKDAPLTRRLTLPQEGQKDDPYWGQYLGERDRDGNFPLEANLNELALLLRASLLLTPERFSGLAKNGALPGSTLSHEADQHQEVLRGLRAMAKTGTASDQRGNPLVGHLMVAWPREDPQFLAVFRAAGSNGASNLRRAAPTLRQWSSRYTAASGQVRVRLMTLTPRDSWELIAECPSFEREGPDGGRLRFSTCGQFKILSSARGSRTERFVRGVVQSFPDGGKVLLQTDPETYAEAVLAAEAQDLAGAAREALRAVIVWNGIHGAHRHADTLSLCDTTHCMVFQGQTTDSPGKPKSATDPALLELLDRLAGPKKLDWLSFSEGGAEQWERGLPAGELRQVAGESAILDLRRERNKNGEIVIHLLYPETEERVSCEVFRARLKLPSCPDRIQSDPANNGWLFGGTGKGHGQGLSVDRARTLARSGHDAAAILQDAYQ